MQTSVDERELDGLMQRTQNRPMVQGRMSLGTANLWAYGLSALGTLMLGLGANWQAAAIAVATLLLYVWVYTPMKTRTSLATVVGAVPGALPPMIGFAAAHGSAPFASWSLFAIMFFWQLPHFLAIAWMYRDDYARAKMPMLPVIDADGIMTGRQSVMYSAALVPVSVLPMFFGLSTLAYGVGAMMLGIFLTIVAMIFALKRSRDNARMLFLSSITYLPLLLILMAVTRR